MIFTKSIMRLSTYEYTGPFEKQRPRHLKQRESLSELRSFLLSCNADQLYKGVAQICPAGFGLHDQLPPDCTAARAIITLLTH